MDTFNALTQLGVNHFALLNAGKILGIIEMTEEIQALQVEKVKEYSWGIAVDITENLLSRTRSGISDVLKDYLADKLVHWVQSSLGWTKYEVVFKENVLVKIPKSDFEKFDITKDELLNYLNKVWIYKGNPKYRIASVSNCPDSDLDIQIFFNLKFF